MREKELRLATICYGGISLAVYMHGITKEIWRLAQASEAHHRHAPAQAADPAFAGTGRVYADLLAAIAGEGGLNLRVLVDILAGASAGGINAIFLAEAISTGRSLDPLTDLWLECADVEALVDPAGGPVARFAKGAAVPLAWLLAGRGAGGAGSADGHRSEIRLKLARFVRGRWFAPPFGGARFTHMLLDAMTAMAAAPPGRPLLPAYQPLDLFVSVTDFNGYPERLRLNSPPEVIEREHRMTLSFRDPGGEGRRLADPASLAFAARATASFPGAFPPFRVAELDAALAARGDGWPERESFLARALPRHMAIGDADQAVLIDGSVLANAPFGPAIAALADRPARREVDRRFVYIDPKPGVHSVRLGGGGSEEGPGFFSTILGALSDIPREQPIRDSLEAIEQRSSRIRRTRRIVTAMRPEVEAAIERAFGSTFFLASPTPKRFAGWRNHAQNVAAREAGYAYAGYGHLKLSRVVEEMAALVFRLGGGGGEREQAERVRRALWDEVRARRITAPDAMTARGARPDVVLFLRRFDISFRTRRLRFVARELNAIENGPEDERDARQALRATLYDLISGYRARTDRDRPDARARAAFARAHADPAAAIEALAGLLGLEALDDEADARIAAAIGDLPKGDRRALVLAYLGYPFYDIATLPLLQGEGLDEFDPVKVDRISPDDATAIRKGGAEATLKGIAFNSFGAFFSRAYRENDYLWGRLHGAERLIDILVSTLPPGAHLAPGHVARFRQAAFRAILAEERGRLGEIGPLLDAIEAEIGGSADDEDSDG